MTSTTATHVATKGTKTNERPGTRASVRSVRMSAYKAREVLDLIRGKDVALAEEILRFSERDAAIVVAKLLHSAVANASNNDDQIPEDLFVAACYADEGRTIRRFRPRARGRATRIRKRTCNMTIIVSRLPEDELSRRRAKEATRPGSRAARRAGQQAVEEGRRTRRHRGRGGDPSAADVAAAEEREGIVDQQAPAIAQADEGSGPNDVDDTDGIELSDQTTSAEEAGIVDQQQAATEAVEEADDPEADPASVAGVQEVAGTSGSPEAELATDESVSTEADTPTEPDSPKASD